MRYAVARGGLAPVRTALVRTTVIRAAVIRTALIRTAVIKPAVIMAVCAALVSGCQPGGIFGGPAGGSGSAGAGGSGEASAAAPTGAAGSPGPDAPGSPGPDGAGPAFIHADRLYLAGRVTTLGSPGDPGPVGWLAPLGVPSPDGRYLAYRSRQPRPDGQGAPEIRIRQLATGVETVLAVPGTSLAWGVDGRIAYAVGDDPLRGYDRPDRPDGRGPGQYGVFVRASPADRPERWTDGATDYAVAAWAGPRLLAYRLDRSGRPDLLALDGPSGSAGSGAGRPGAGRPGAAGAPAAPRSLGRGVLVAVSPDGERAFIAETGDAPTPNVRVVRVADGAMLARLDLTGTGVQGVEYAGDWSGDRVVAAAWPDPVVFRVGPREIRIDRLLRIESDGHPYGLREPGFFGGSVVGWAAADATEDPPTIELWCPLAGTADRCVDRARFAPPGAAHPVRNPSRPLPRADSLPPDSLPPDYLPPPTMSLVAETPGGSAI